MFLICLMTVGIVAISGVVLLACTYGPTKGINLDAEDQ